MNTYYVYILASRRNGTLYVGVTNDLVYRIARHREGEASGFTSKYKVTRLVYLEPHQSIDEAIRREKRLKKWRRQWKLNLVENFNPQWRDLWDEIAIGEQITPRSRLARPSAAWPG
jgi:putative endonuclease